MDIDNIDEMDEDYVPIEEHSNPEEGQVSETQTPEQDEEEQSEDNRDVISELLKSNGIPDATKIKYENDKGETEEVDWNTLSVDEQLNILDSFHKDSGLDEAEVQLINAIRDSQLTPAEYLQYIQKSSVDAYIQNTQQNNYVYSVDQYSDDELYVMDLISKSSDITEDEAMEMLERAKSNESLFNKQISAIRDEYKRVEAEGLQQAQMQEQQIRQEQYNEFAEQIQNSILNFTEFANCQLNMEEEDMINLYDFITGFDNAGNRWFQKALNDPDTVVKMAWFALNGEQMIEDLHSEYAKVITKLNEQVKGNKDTSKSVYKPKNRSKASKYDDLDNF